jgi:hypothetical protein
MTSCFGSPASTSIGDHTDEQIRQRVAADAYDLATA